MNKKAVITVILATILALISAFLILNKNTTENQNKEVVTPGEETVIAEEKAAINEEDENIEEQTEEIKPAVTTTKPVKKTITKSSAIKPEVPVFDKIVVQEGSVVEETEIEPDYGIRKIGDTIEVTREFKIKSPTNYSFKDLGILDKVSTK